VVVVFSCPALSKMVFGSGVPKAVVFGAAVFRAVVFGSGVPKAVVFGAVALTAVVFGMGVAFADEENSSVASGSTGSFLAAPAAVDDWWRAIVTICLCKTLTPTPRLSSRTSIVNWALVGAVPRIDS
jgi:hypothetical protein